MSPERPLIAVFGSSTLSPDDAPWAVAFDVGRELALAGADVMTGGYGGAMEACSRGAHEAGGHVIGVTVELFEQRGPANRWVKELVHTPHLYDRLQFLMENATGFIVLSGSIGTLTELFMAWTLVSVGGRSPAPIVLLGARWPEMLSVLRGPDGIPAELFRHIQVASDPRDATRRALMARSAARSEAVPGVSSSES